MPSSPSHTRPTVGIAPPGYRLPDATRLGLRVLRRTDGAAVLGARAEAPLVDLIRNAVEIFLTLVPASSTFN